MAFGGARDLVKSEMFRAIPREVVVGAGRFELPTSWSRTKRATRLRYAPTFYSVMFISMTCPERCRAKPSCATPR